MLKSSETFARSISIYLEEKLTCFLADSLVSHLATPAAVEESPTIVSSGQNLSAPFVELCRPGLLLKMLTGSVNLRSTWFAHRWRVKGTPSGRLVFQLQPLAPGNDASVFGSLPTITARELKTENKMRKAATLTRAVNLAQKIKYLPTLLASDARYRAYREGRKKGNTLPEIIGKMNGLKLSPSFAEILQGYPVGWTELSRSEIRSCHKLRKLSLTSSTK